MLQKFIKNKEIRRTMSIQWGKLTWWKLKEQWMNYNCITTSNKKKDLEHTAFPCLSLPLNLVRMPIESVLTREEKALICSHCRGLVRTRKSTLLKTREKHGPHALTFVQEKLNLSVKMWSLSYHKCLFKKCVLSYLVTGLEEMT